MSYLDALAVIIAYFTGSISFAILLCHCLGKSDPRTTGSGNPGATNVLQESGKMLAFLTLLGDILKSFFPIAIAVHYGLSQTSIAAMCVASLLGHTYPVFHRFQGGKGVASFLGIMLAANLSIGLIWVVTWLSTAAIFRYSSLAGITACLITPFAILFLWGSQEIALTLASAMMAVLVVARHHQNIKRLRAGTEPKLSSG